MVKLLRHDLVIFPSQDDRNTLIVKNPSTSEQFEFNGEEAYLLNELKTPYNEKVLLIKFNAKFRANKTDQYISDMISKLDERGLLEDQDKAGKYGLLSTPVLDKERAEPIRESNKRKRINHWSMFSPQRLLDLVTQWFGFFRYFNIPLLLLFVLAAYTLFSNLHLFQEDLSRISSKLPFFKHLVFTLFTVNLFSQIIKGCIARYYKIETSSFGIMLAYGIIPRFDIQVDITEETSREAKLHLVSSSILARIFLFSTGIMLWILTRPMGTNLSSYSAALGLFSIFSLFFVVNPLLSGDGYRLITLYYEIPNIREKAVRSVRNYFFSTPEVISKYTDDRLALKIYGSLSILFIVSVITFVGLSVGYWLEENYRGFGVVLFLLIIVYLLLRFRYLSGAKKALRAGKIQDENFLKSRNTSLDKSGLKKKSFQPFPIRFLRSVGCASF